MAQDRLLVNVIKLICDFDARLARLPWKLLTPSSLRSTAFFMTTFLFVTEIGKNWLSSEITRNSLLRLWQWWTGVRCFLTSLLSMVRCNRSKLATSTAAVKFRNPEGYCTLDIISVIEQTFVSTGLSNPHGKTARVNKAVQWKRECTNVRLTAAGQRTQAAGSK